MFSTQTPHPWQSVNKGEILVFGQDDPTALADLTQPLFVFDPLAVFEMGLMAYDVRAGLPQTFRHTASAEALIDEEDEIRRR
jgi:hypothetical protein